MIQLRDFSRGLIEDLVLLRSELVDKVDSEFLERLDFAISRLQSQEIENESPKKILFLLGFVIEHLPSIISAIDRLIHR